MKKKDPKFRKLELTGLVSTNYTYWVVDATYRGTPSLVKTADPYSTLVLSPLMTLISLRLPIRIYRFIQKGRNEK
jgi:hypothetical protein